MFLPSSLLSSVLLVIRFFVPRLYVAPSARNFLLPSLRLCLHASITPGFAVSSSLRPCLLTSGRWYVHLLHRPSVLSPFGSSVCYRSVRPCIRSPVILSLHPFGRYPVPLFLSPFVVVCSFFRSSVCLLACSAVCNEHISFQLS